ncbi:MAG: hypothetical protein Q7V19_04290 [Bacteroidales bacterium]|nr:hypothetical protein [Bacteroidales bacterium]MDP2236548.1 hypothetical protein [Bacteroidales bacterium]
MKKQILLSCILLIGATASYAQIEKGSTIGGMNGNFSFQSTHSANSLNFGFNPYALYFVKENFALGLSIENNFSMFKTKTASYNREVKTFELLITPEMRKYFGTGKLMPFIGLSTGLHFYQFYHSDPHPKGNPYNFYLAPEAGLSWWLNDKVFIDLKAKYDLINTNRGSGNHTINVNIGIGFKLGK